MDIVSKTEHLIKNNLNPDLNSILEQLLCEIGCLRRQHNLMVNGLKRIYLETNMIHPDKDRFVKSIVLTLLKEVDEIL